MDRGSNDCCRHGGNNSVDLDEQRHVQGVDSVAMEHSMAHLSGFL